MRKLNIPKKQKFTIGLIFIFITVLFTFTIFMYLPLRQQLTREKGEFSTIESEIKKIRMIAGEDKPLEEVIILLKNKLEGMESKFPPREEIMLKEISRLMATLGMQVKSIRPGKRRIVKDIKGAPINIKDRQVNEMSVSINLRASYKTLGEFLRILKESFPVFVRVDSLRLNKISGEGKAILDVELRLSTYLISPVS